MAKLQSLINYDVRPMRSRSRRPWTALVVLAGVLLVPLGIEGTFCCYAQWCEVLGRPTDVKTPILDAIVSGLQKGHELLGEQVGPSLHRVIHEPNIAVPVSAMMIVLAITLLKR